MSQSQISLFGLLPVLSTIKPPTDVTDDERKALQTLTLKWESQKAARFGLNESATTVITTDYSPGNGTRYRLHFYLLNSRVFIAWPDMGWSAGDLSCHAPPDVGWLSSELAPTGLLALDATAIHRAAVIVWDRLTRRSCG